jgi:phosphoribosylformimino-5-aminoimidazole carboxamide ribotide isomerase
VKSQKARGGTPRRIPAPGESPERAGLTLIPAIDLLQGRVVRLREGDFGRRTFYPGSPAEYARRWGEEGPPRLHLVDLEGAVAGRPVQERLLRGVIDRSPVPCQVAGGIRYAETVAQVLSWGADRVVMGTALLKDPALAASLVAEFGADRIVSAIDVRDGIAVGSGWVPGAAGMPYAQALTALDAAGIKTFAVTSIARDGLEQGPDWDLLADAANVVGAARIIASGGVTTANDVARLAAGGLGGAILGRALYEGTLSLADALAAAGQLR